ncbi:MAG TPA: DUF1778 domain-containing protein [Burkholderiaceae bacterium]|nr:DUF1778 domain-containing protein [Burkholderiaceae bacterium]
MKLSRKWRARRDRATDSASLDRTLLAVRPDAFAAFLARLDAPAQPNARLGRTMQTPSPWDKG